MDILLYFIRDNLKGTHYFIYASVLLFLMFAIIGYLFKQKYGKLDLVLNGSQDSATSKYLKEKMVEAEKIKEASKNGGVISEKKVIPINENQTPLVLQQVAISNDKLINNAPQKTTTSTEIVAETSRPINAATPEVVTTTPLVTQTVTQPSPVTQTPVITSENPSIMQTSIATSNTTQTQVLPTPIKKDSGNNLNAAIPDVEI